MIGLGQQVGTYPTFCQGEKPIAQITIGRLSYYLQSHMHHHEYSQEHKSTNGKDEEVPPYKFGKGYIVIDHNNEDAKYDFLYGEKAEHFPSKLYQILIILFIEHFVEIPGTCCPTHTVETPRDETALGGLGGVSATWAWEAGVAQPTIHGGHEARWVNIGTARIGFLIGEIEGITFI